MRETLQSLCVRVSVCERVSVCVQFFSEWKCFLNVIFFIPVFNMGNGLVSGSVTQAWPRFPKLAIHRRSSKNRHKGRPSVHHEREGRKSQKPNPGRLSISTLLGAWTPGYGKGSCQVFSMNQSCHRGHGRRVWLRLGFLNMDGKSPFTHACKTY